MRDGAAERRRLGAFALDMDPLEILDRARKRIDALLADFDPRRDADFLADAALETAQGQAPGAHFVSNSFCSVCIRLWFSLRRRGAFAGSSRSSSATSAW